MSAPEPEVPKLCAVRGCIGKLLRKEAQGTIQLHCLAAAHHRGWLVQDDRELKWEFSTRGKRWLKGEAVQAQRGGAPLGARGMRSRFVQDCPSGQALFSY